MVTLNQFCGDGTPQSPQEECDNGVKNNKAVYGTKNGCTTGCTWAHYCGDGVVDATNDEQCDAGAGNGSGLCDANCRYKPK